MSGEPGLGKYGSRGPGSTGTRNIKTDGIGRQGENRLPMPISDPGMARRRKGGRVRCPAGTIPWSRLPVRCARALRPGRRRLRLSEQAAPEQRLVSDRLPFLTSETRSVGTRTLKTTSPISSESIRRFILSQTLFSWPESTCTTYHCSPGAGVVRAIVEQ